jgi:hypothetical protein
MGEATEEIKKGKKPGRPDNLKQNIETFARHCKEFYTVTCADKKNIDQKKIN